MAKREQLIRAYPQHGALIEGLTWAQELFDFPRGEIQESANGRWGSVSSTIEARGVSG